MDQKGALDTVYKANEGFAESNQKLKDELKELQSSYKAAGEVIKHLSDTLSKCGDELDALKKLSPKDGIFHILHKLELPEQVSVINQVSAIKAITLRKKLDEADNAAQYLRNNLRQHELNMANIVNGTTVQP